MPGASGAGLIDALEVAGRMAAGTLDALPVVELGRLIGIVTVTDVLAAEVQRSMTGNAVDHR